MDYLNLIYTILWGILAMYCYISAHKKSNVLYLAGVFFTFMFGWYLANQLLDINLFQGMYNIIFRCIAGGFLAIFIIIYLLYKKRSS